MGPSSPLSILLMASITGVFAWMVASVLDSRIFTFSSGYSCPNTRANLAPDCSAFWNCLLILMGAMGASVFMPALRSSARVLSASGRLDSSARTM